MSKLVRETRETKIEITLVPGTGIADVQTGHAFLDHMMTAFAAYASLDLTLRASGDLPHHLIEDVAIATGEALARIVPVRARRYGERTIPMDDALVHVAADLGGRPYYEGPLPAPIWDHWMRSFAMQARATLHVRVLRGTDKHHVVEAAFKALGLSVREAIAEGGALFSTKGSVQWREEDDAC